MSKEKKPFVSVVIPVFNDLSRLTGCLSVLEQQTYPRERYEVIVVDNGSDEDISSIADQFPQIKFGEEKQPGSYAARNRGIDLAIGDIIGFTDSDCIPGAEWLERATDYFLRDPANGIVGGRVEFFFKDGDRPTAVELYDSIRHLQQKDKVAKTSFAATANMFTRKSVIGEVGKFDASVKSGGDREWGQRAASAGYSMLYAEDVVVLHPARSTLRQLYKKTVRVIGGHHQLMSQNGYSIFHPDFLKSLAHDLSPPVRFARRLLKDNRILGGTNKFKVLIVFMLDKIIQAWTRIKMQLGGAPSR